MVAVRDGTTTENDVSGSAASELKRIVYFILTIWGIPSTTAGMTRYNFGFEHDGEERSVPEGNWDVRYSHAQGNEHRN